MVKHIFNLLSIFLVAFILGPAAPELRAADIPSGIVAVFPHKEPVGEPDLGPPGSGSVSDDSSNLTLDFGFYVPTPTPSPTASATPSVTPSATAMPSGLTVVPETTPTPTVVVISSLTPTPTPTPGSGGLNAGQQFGKWPEMANIEKPCVVVPAEIEKPWFITDIAMYAASEMQATSHPFIRWAEENGLALERTFLAPTEVREFGAEILEFSVNNINTVMANAGIGLPLKFAPFIIAGAKAQKLTAEDYLAERLQDFARRSNLKTPPNNPHPLFLEYAAGDPRYTTFANVNNWNTLLWDSRSFDKMLIPSAYGQTLLRQVLLLEEFLATNHKADGTKDRQGEFVGVDDVKGFLGLLTAEAIVNKLWFMQNDLLYRPDNSKSEIRIPYFPYQTAVDPDSLATDQPNVQVVNGQSRLFDQLSLLWALSELLAFTETEASQQAFRQDGLVPGVQNLDFAKPARALSAKAVHDLARQLAAIVFTTIKQAHYAPAEQTLIDLAPMDSAKQTPQEQPAPETTAARTVSTVHLGLSIAALQRYYDAMHREPATQKQIMQLIRAAADYLVNQVYDQKDGGFFENTPLPASKWDYPPLPLPGGDTPLPPSRGDYPPLPLPGGEGGQPAAADGRGAKTLEAQMAGIRGLLAAYKLTQDVRYRRSAFETYQYAEKALWNEELEVYKDRETRSGYRYTPLSVGAVVGALRELIYQADDPQQALQMAKRMQTFVKQIAKYAGLQLSEVVTKNDWEFLIPVDATSVIRTAQALDSAFGLAPVLGAEIRLNAEAIAALHAKRPSAACQNTRNSFRSTYYYTDIGMYAASEFTLTATDPPLPLPGGDSDALAKNRNAELLNPVSLETTGAKQRDFSDYNLTHIQGSSGLGVQLQYGPLVSAQAKQQNTSANDYLKRLLEQYAALAGLKTVPAKLTPIFIEFEGGVPEIEYGKETERWLDGNMKKALVPSALGQTLVRQVLWLQAALATRHDERNRASAAGTYVGRNAEEGFFGLLVAQAIANKLLFLQETMLVPLKTQTGTLAVPSGKYFPHRLTVQWDGAQPTAYTVEDAASYLFDQVSLLWGLSEFKRLAEPRGPVPYADIFGEGKIIPGNFQAIAKELAAIILENLEALHWNAAYQTFVDVNTLEQPKDDSPHPQPLSQGARGAETQRNVISMEQAAMAMIALESVCRNFPEDPQLQAKAKRLLLSQGAFIAQQLSRSSDGAAYNGASLPPFDAPSTSSGQAVQGDGGRGNAVEPFSGLKTLLAHAAAIRSFLIAYEVSGEQAYLEKAKQTFEFLDKTFWDGRRQVYRSMIGGSSYHYTPLNTGMTVGALRELLRIGGAAYFEVVNDHLTKFFEYVVARIGLQLSEQRQRFELAGAPKTLAPIIASDLIIRPAGTDVDLAVPQLGSTLVFNIGFTPEALRCGADEAYIEDLLPEGMTFVSSTPAPAYFDGRIIRWRVSDLTQNENGVYIVRLEVTINPLAIAALLPTSGAGANDLLNGQRAWHLNNCAALWCQAVGQPEYQVATDCSDNVLSRPQLGIEKALRTITVEPGNEAEFDVLVTNLSDVTAYTVTIQDQLPAGFTYLADSVRSPETVKVALDDQEPLVWATGDLEPKKSLRLTYKVMVDNKLEEGLYRTTVKVYALDRAGFQFETNEFELDVKVERAVVLNLTQKLAEQEKGQKIEAGKPVTVLATLENSGSEHLLDGTVSVTLPEGITYTPDSSRVNGVAIADPAQEGQTLRWKLGELPISIRKTLQYQLQIRAGLTGQPKLTTEIRGTTGAGKAYRSKAYTVEIKLAP